MSTDQMPRVVVLAGNDPSGGAGLARDILTCANLGAMALPIVTTLTSQNHQSVTQSVAVAADVLRGQLQSIENEQICVVKIGLLPNAELLDVFLNWRQHHADVLVVYDPVLIASSGYPLVSDDLLPSLTANLGVFDLLTPNWDELSQLTGRRLHTEQDVREAAASLLAQGAKAVYVKGGHGFAQYDDCFDYFANANLSCWFKSPKIHWAHQKVRGTGCTLASSIASLLAQQYELADAITLARAYVQQAYDHSIENSSGTRSLAQLGLPKDRRYFPEVWDKFPPQLPTAGFPLEPMHLPTESVELYGVVDHLAWLERLAQLGVPIIQLRLKNQSLEDVEAQIVAAKTICERYQVRFYVNDYWQLAIQHRVYGVHLGQEDIIHADVTAIAAAGLHLGLSTHSYWEACRALALKPSYLALGPIFPTTTKIMRFCPQGLTRLRYWVEVFGAQTPICAIGGINTHNFDAVRQTGVPIIAMVNGLRLDHATWQQDWDLYHTKRT